MAPCVAPREALAMARVRLQRVAPCGPVMLGCPAGVGLQRTGSAAAFERHVSVYAGCSHSALAPCHGSYS